MKRYILSLFALCVLSVNANASTIVRCELKVDIKSHVTKIAPGNRFLQMVVPLDLEVKEQKAYLGSHHDCSRMLNRTYGKQLLVPLELLPINLRKGRRVTVNYNFFSGMTPTGVVSNEKWELTPNTTPVTPPPTP